MASKHVKAAAEEMKFQRKTNEMSKTQFDVFVDAVAWVLSAAGHNIDTAEWRKLCGLKPHRD